MLKRKTWPFENPKAKYRRQAVLPWFRAGVCPQILALSKVKTVKGMEGKMELPFLTEWFDEVEKPSSLQSRSGHQET